MMNLPKHINILSHQVGKNLVWRCYGSDNIILDNTDEQYVKSKNPFVVEQDGRRILLTSDENAAIPLDCPYAVLVNKKPNGPLFTSNSLNVLRWLKHPSVNETLTPDEITGSWRGKFTFIEEDKAAKLPGLRIPQAGAIHAWLSTQHTRKDRATIVMPTGTGKTEAMLGIMVAAPCKKILVTVPHDALREQISDKFITLGKLHEFGIVSKDCKNPYVALVNNGMEDVNDWRDLIDHSNVIVTTMALLAKTSDEVKRLLAANITNVFVDEAHHSEASSWSQFLDVFKRNIITQFTATPFRNDGRKLKGEFVYTFTLRAAQQQGYYEKINFNPVYEIDREKADQAIADQAVAILRRDIANGKDHLLMARCRDTVRAAKVLDCYKHHTDLNPVVIYSGITGKQRLLEEIKRKEHKIIVCVNMLGEGFDLPELKVAAIHDEKQSLPITLQFIGRFTRTSGTNIGEASFVTNMAYPPMADEIRDLYLKDADWNLIIPGLNDKATEEQRAFSDLMTNFPDVELSDIPFQSINPALSTVIYRLDRFAWTPGNWAQVYTEKDYDYRYANVNADDDMMVIILGSQEGVAWTSFEGLENRTWNVILLHKYDAGIYKHLYINSSLDNKSFDKLVEALFGAKQEKIAGDVVFRSFHGLHRILVQTFGGRKAIAGDISFKSYIGRDVENGISEATQGQLTQNNIFASGIFHGERITHGCSKSGKVWSYRRGNLLSFKKWSHHIGRLVEDPTIDTNELFKNTLRVNPVGACPKVVPIAADWDDEIYKNIEYEQMLKVDGIDDEIYLFDAELEITTRAWDLKNFPSDILFQLRNDNFCTEYRITFSATPNGGLTRYDYHVEKVGGPDVQFRRGAMSFGDLLDYFNTEKRSPVFFFADGGMLYANNWVELRETTTPFAIDDLIDYDWVGEGVSIKDESMDFPHKTNSIQYYMWHKIKDDYELIFDDDGSGEVADLIGVNTDDDNIYVSLYHLKFASGGKVSQKISNFYEVCGQAQKSLKWKNPDMSVFRKLIQRTKTTTKGENRILKGDLEMLKQLDQDAAVRKRVKVSLHIVQPGLSKANPPADILQLLGVVKNYAFEVCNADLNVYCSK